MIHRLARYACVALVAAIGLIGGPRLRADDAEDQYAVAAGHYAAQRWELAVAEFRGLIKDHPEDPKGTKSLFFLGEALVQLGKYEEAATEFKRFLARDPQSSYARQAMFRAGEADFLAGKRAVARRALDDFRDKYPDDKLNAYVLMYLGEIALADKDAAAAKSLLGEALERFPGLAPQDEIHFGLARAAELKGDRDAAEKLYRELAVGHDMAFAEQAQLRLAMLQLQSRQYARAAEAFGAFENDHPQSRSFSEAQLGHAKALFQLGQLDRSRELLEPLAANPEFRIEAQYWLGLVFAAKQDWAAASKTFGKLLETDPGDPLGPQIRYHLADAQYHTADYASAIKTLEAAARIASDSSAANVANSDPQSLANRYLFALAYQGTKRDADALALLDAIGHDAHDELAAKIQLARASSLIAVGKSAAAAEALEAYLKSPPDGDYKDRALAQLAICYARAKRVDAARDAFTRFQAIQSRLPRDMGPNELTLATTQQLAEAVLSAGDPRWAGELFAALTADGIPAEFVVPGLSGLGWCQLQTGENDQAAATFDRLLERFPDGPAAAEAAWSRGQVLERLKNFDAALASYQLIVEKHATSKRFDDALLAAARLNSQLHQNSQGIELYQRFLRERPDSQHLDAARYGLAWALRDMGNRPAADEQFQSLHDDSRQSRFWYDATFRLAESALGQRQSDRAEHLLDELVAAQPPAEIVQHALYLKGQVAAADQKWDRVAAVMAELARTYPDSALRLPAEYWIAEAAYRQGQFDEAGKRFTALSDQIAGRKDKWLAMVPLRRAQVLAQQKQWSDAQAIATRIETDYPDFSEQYEVDYLLGRALAAQADFAGARKSYLKVIHSATGGKTETAAMAQWMIGESYFHQENYDAALREYLRVEILYPYPRWQAAALLQAGKCQEALGHGKDAAELYARLIKVYSNTEFTEEATRRLHDAETQSTAAASNQAK